MAAGCNSRQAPDEGRFSGAGGGFLQTRSPCSAVSSGDRGVRTAVEENQPWRDRRRASRPAGRAEEPVAGTIRFTRHDAIVITVRTSAFIICLRCWRTSQRNTQSNPRPQINPSRPTLLLGLFGSLVLRSWSFTTHCDLQVMSNLPSDG